MVKLDPTIGGDDEPFQASASAAQIKSLFKRLVSVQEDERRRIARDLHDHLGQQLTALRMNLEVFRLQCGLDEARLKQLERTQWLAEELDRSIDFLTWQLRPPTLEHHGLGVALGELVHSWGERFSLDAQYHAVGMDNVRLPRDAEENLYRIAQEALNNVVKHANATQVNVVFKRGGDVATLVIQDDGRGFEMRERGGAGEEDRCMGLANMRERAALLGGEMSIDSTQGGGTAINVRVPIARG